MPTQPPLVPRPRKPGPPRPSSTARGYDHKHAAARAELLAMYPVCQLCEDAWSTDLHHVDENPFNTDPRNRLAVCEDCHHRRLHGRR